MDQRSVITTSAGDSPALSPTRLLPQKTTSDHNAASQDSPARRRRRRAHVRKTSSEDSCTGSGEELVTDEKMEVEKKIAALQKIVPGGETLAVEQLFEETAEYIMALECQVEALRFLAAFVVQGSSDKQKRKLGG